MRIHSLKIAWRNLLKYKTQSVISIVGLAIGFTAFSFTLSWIRYERGYDKHNPDADRIFALIPKKEDVSLSSPMVATALPDYLQSRFAEIEAITLVSTSQYIAFGNEQPKDEWARFLYDCRFTTSADASFFSVFYPDIKINFSRWDLRMNESVILTRSIAEKWNITENNLGMKIDSLHIVPIAIIPDQSLHSNVAFRMMNIYETEKEWNHSRQGRIYVRLHKNVDVEVFAEKVDTIHMKEADYIRDLHFKLVPIRELHYTYPEQSTNLKFTYLKYMGVVALSVIFCALINYVMLFINRIKARSRELALRKVNGASNNNLLLLLITEFVLLLFSSLLIGGLLTELFFPAFEKFAMTALSKSYFLIALLWYGLLIMITSMVCIIALMRYYMQRSVREIIHPQMRRRNIFKNQFAMMSIFLQLVIGALLIFCTGVFFYQYTLLSHRVGYDRKDILAFDTMNEDRALPLNDIYNIKGVNEIALNLDDFLNTYFQRTYPTEIIDSNQKIDTKELCKITVDSSFIRFFSIPLIEGRNISEKEHNGLIINQTAKQVIGGDVLTKRIEGLPILGVIPDLHVESHLVPIRPTVYRLIKTPSTQIASKFTIRCMPGMVSEVRDQVLDLNKKINQDTLIGFIDLNSNFKEYTKSERHLLILLAIMTGVAILVSVFGIYSMITLSCNQRRKEIAIRKVNGAKAREIFMLFFRQYFLVTILSCIVAFPLGVYIMQRWLEQYTRRVELEWWLFAGIFLLVSLIVLGSIYSRVYKAANENPADVVKSE